MTHPDCNFCDDFEDGTLLVRQGRYFEHDDNNGDFVIINGAGSKKRHSVGTRALT